MGGEKPTTVTIQLPAKWMVQYFVDWVDGAWIEQMLAYEGQRLMVKEQPDETMVIFIRDVREGDS